MTAWPTSKAVLTSADSAKPPVRLPLGLDTVAQVENKNRFVEEELELWRDVALSTNLDDVPARADAYICCSFEVKGRGGFATCLLAKLEPVASIYE